MQTMENKQPKTYQTMGRILAPTFTRSHQELSAFSGLTPTNTSQLNQHAHDKRKYRKLVMMETNGQVDNSRDATERSQSWFS